MLALFREIAIAWEAQPDAQNTAYRAGLLTALHDLRLIWPFRIWCRLSGYRDLLDTLVLCSVKQE